MEEKTFTVKIEPENSLEYNLNQEMNLEIKTELGTPIKSEAVFKEELHDFEQLEYEPDSKSFPPIIEDLDSSKWVLKTVALEYVLREFEKLIDLKSSIKILGSLPDSNQDYESEKFQPLIIPVIKEVNVSNMEESSLRLHVRKKAVLERLRKEANVLNMVDLRINVRKKDVLNMLSKEVNVLTMVEPILDIHVKQKAVLNMLSKEVNVSITEEYQGKIYVKQKAVLNMLSKEVNVSNTEEFRVRIHVEKKVVQ
ncbi:unnamed protein product [Timema podura]|uniref:Uncharacterized protein n=1 Tax=Timema podura TaxID=61482 RepID=A0ABN7P0X9_TIMPD|nr:unnamed protein product [Timema podura]